MGKIFPKSCSIVAFTTIAERGRLRFTPKEGIMRDDDYSKEFWFFIICYGVILLGIFLYPQFFVRLIF